MQELLKQINEEIASFQADANKFLEKDNQAAGRRSRKTSTKIAGLFKEWRAKTVKGSSEVEE